MRSALSICVFWPTLIPFRAKDHEEIVVNHLAAHTCMRAVIRQPWFPLVKPAETATEIAFATRLSYNYYSYGFQMLPLLGLSLKIRTPTNIPNV